MPQLSVSVLGPLVVARNAVPIEAFGYNKVRALLVYLAVEGGRAHTRAHLCGLLWPEAAERAARRSLSQALTQLRRALDDADAPAGQPLLSTADDVQLNPALAVQVDAAQFAGLLAACERHAHHAWHTCAACAQRQQAALALYRGGFLAGFSLPDSAPFEEWALLWRERLQQRALSALQRLAAWAEWRGDFGLAAAYARRQVELDPLNEAAHRNAMRLLALNGEPAAAEAQYAEAQRVLAAELGVPPEAATTALRDQIRGGAGETLRRLKAPPFNGPRPPNDLIGRAEALAAVVARLRDEAVRVLTLTGPPGIGKTRLALEAAAALRYDFDDGVCFIELAPVAEPAGVPAALARALGVKERPARSVPEALHAHLRDTHALLVLDNCEHVLEAAGFVAGLLAACPGLKVLATSRRPLRIRAEHLQVVDPLAEAAAQQLFEARSRAAGGPLAADPNGAAAVAEICRRLDYLPLGIELVAVHARAVPPAELLRQLERPLSALTTAPRDLPQRQHSLRSAIAWSYDRLSAAEQRAFRQLGVFAGGGSLEAAQAVAAEDGDVWPRLEALHEASLVQVNHAGGAPQRFSLLQTLREFALEQAAQAGEVEAARDRHLAYHLAWAEAAQPALGGPEQAQWLDRLERDHDNLRAALAHARTLESDAELRLAVALGPFWEVRGHLTEGRRWLAAALARRPQARLPLRGAALELAGALAYHQGDYPAARALAEQGLGLWRQLEDAPAVTATLRRLGAIAYETGDLPGARAYGEQSLALARESGDARGIAGALNNLGLIASNEGDYARAAALYHESLPVFRQLADHYGAGLALTNLGLAAWNQTDYAAARAWLAEGLAAFRAIGHKWGCALALLNLGNVAYSLGEVDEAQTHLNESLALFREVGDQASLAYPLLGLGLVALAHRSSARARALFRESLTLRRQAGEVRALPRSLESLGQVDRAEGQYAKAARLFGAAAALRERLSVRITPQYRAEYEAETAALRAALGEAGFEQAWAAGRALSLEAALALALED